jgi:hypothetical protein
VEYGCTVTPKYRATDIADEMIDKMSGLAHTGVRYGRTHRYAAQLPVSASTPTPISRTRRNSVSARYWRRGVVGVVRNKNRRLDLCMHAEALREMAEKPSCLHEPNALQD